MFRELKPRAESGKPGKYDRFLGFRLTACQETPPADATCWSHRLVRVSPLDLYCWVASLRPPEGANSRCSADYRPKSPADHGSYSKDRQPGPLADHAEDPAACTRRDSHSAANRRPNVARRTHHSHAHRKHRSHLGNSPRRQPDRRFAHTFFLTGKIARLHRRRQHSNHWSSH